MNKLQHDKFLFCGVIFSAIFAANATAAIDFESVPGVGVPTEGLIISDQYLDSAGVTFALESGGNPRIAKVGSPRTAFEGFGGADDLPAPNQGIGNYFLTDNGTLSGLFSPALIVQYATPTAAASGVLLDIDFGETWTIQAKDSNNNVIETISITAGDPSTGDGLATPWSFDHALADISLIRFEGTRTQSGAFGLGFDNFSPTSPIPEPQTFVMFFAGLGVVLMAVRRKARRSSKQ